MTRPDPLSLVQLTLADPRRGARAVLDLGLQPGERLAALALVAILNVLAVLGFARLVPEAPDDVLTALLDQPLAFAGAQLGGMLLMATLIHWVGRLFGGRGHGAGALEVVIWLQALLLGLQVAQIVAMALFPPLALMFSLASLACLIWLLPNFVAELHGFRSALMTALGMIATAGLLLLALSLALAARLAPGL